MEPQGQKLRNILRAFSLRTIAYQKIYSAPEVSGSVTAGLLLSQIVYWWYGPAAEKPFYKTDGEWLNELGFGLYELRAAKARLVSKGLILAQRKTMPAKTFYTLKETALLAQIASYGKKHQLKKTALSARNPSCGKNPQLLEQRLQQIKYYREIYLITHFLIYLLWSVGSDMRLVCLLRTGLMRRLRRKSSMSSIPLWRVLKRLLKTAWQSKNVRKVCGLSKEGISSPH